MAKFLRLKFEELGPQLQSVLPPNSPLGKRMAVAQGVFPLGTKDLLTALYYLWGDEDGRVRQAAQKSLDELPESLTLVGIDAGLSYKVLHYLSSRKYDNNHIYERIALHPAAHVKTLCYLAETNPFEPVLTIIARNETAILKHPEILYGLTRNPHMPLNLIERLKKFYELNRGHDFMQDIAGEQQEAEPAPPPKERPQPEEDDSRVVTANDDRLFGGFRFEDVLSEEFDTDELFADDLIREPDAELDDQKRRSMLQRITKMAMVDRILLAMRGNSAARRVMVKSGNKIIRDCVMRNPRVSTQEILEWAKERSTPQDIIETIARNREWSRNYQIMTALCWHPKTPTVYVLRVRGTLSLQDLKKLGDSKMVPGATAQQARSALRRREKNR